MEPPNSTNASPAPSPTNPERTDPKQAAGLFEMELPVGERLAKKPAPVDLETAIELCQQYREWFGLDGRDAKSRLVEERCRAEFFL